MLCVFPRILPTREVNLSSKCRDKLARIVLTLAACIVGISRCSSFDQTISTGVVLWGDCGTNYSSLVENTASAVMQDQHARLEYTLVAVCKDDLANIMTILNRTYDTSGRQPESVIARLPPSVFNFISSYFESRGILTIVPNYIAFRSPMTGGLGGGSVVSLHPSDRALSRAVDLTLRHFGWQSVHVITDSDLTFVQIAQSVSVDLSTSGYSVMTFQTLSSVNLGNDFNETFTGIDSKIKVILLFVDVQLLKRLLVVWKETSASRSKQVLMATVPSPYAVPTWLDALSELDPVYLERLFLLAPKYNDPTFSRTHNLTNSHSRSKRNVQYSVSGVHVPIDATLYDSFALLLQAARKTTKQDLNAGDSMHLSSGVLNTSLPSPFTDVVIDAEGHTLTGYILLSYYVDSRNVGAVMNLSLSISGDLQLSVIQNVEWTSGVPQPDPCFMKDWSCHATPTENKAELILYILLGLVGAACTGLVVTYLVRRYLARKEMEKGPNKLILCSTDIVFVHRKHMNRSSKTLAKSVMFEKPDILKASEPSYSMTSLNEYVDFSDTARYNGDLVHVKEIQVKGFEMKGKLMSYLRMLRELRHENLNPFLGFLNEPTRPAVITEFCNRGSLEDVIQNEDIKLDWDFKLSLLTDLIRGLRYVHGSHLKHHGFLKSRNCVIDSRWVLKLTDYGMQGVLSICKLTRDLDARDMLWTAPELLRDPLLLQRGSEKGDVFSFAIIMQEVILRSSPYSTTGLTPEEIIQKVRKPPPLIRPSVSQQAAPPQYIQLMKQCWAEMPDMRPDVENIYHQYKSFNHGKKMNIVDTMFKMLEKYSSDLEEIVQNRTTQLEEEKKKTDQLLFRMLPATVAESLKIGKQVEAETFTEVTIYFSDIVGFTTISAMSTPLQVVDLLNDLYTMFDATIDMYDVYKVETIGDAYMVVSGLPTRNGNRHAGEIGTMALDLLSQCGTFVIRHMPEVPLRLRIGLHTGPCVAGVVGLTMPRYCLFGDTVNTASRMESTGGAFRVHLSQKTKDKLDELKGYQTEFRGEVELKGKGIHKTYWLTGKDGFDKPLPEPPEIGLGSVLDSNKDQMSKSKSKSNLADFVGAINTLRKAALGKTSNKREGPESKNNTANTTPSVKQKSTSESPAAGSSRPSTEGQVSLTPITLEVRDTPCK